MLTQHIAILSKTVHVKHLLPAAAAFQKQLSRDVAPLWKINPVIAAFDSVKDVPPDYWQVLVEDNIGEPGAAGYHSDSHHQPFALVQYDGSWTITASHEIIEMSLDPYGCRLRSGYFNGERVRFLVEGCDPPEAFYYLIDGIAVSDFITPSFYDPEGKAFNGAHYSFLNRIAAPRSIARGGYISFVDSGGIWHQQTWFGGPNPKLHTLNNTESMPGKTLREKMDVFNRGLKKVPTT